MPGLVTKDRHPEDAAYAAAQKHGKEQRLFRDAAAVPSGKGLVKPHKHEGKRVYQRQPDRE